MDLHNPSGLTSLGIKALEQTAIQDHNRKSLRIGIPRELTNQETRVCLTPSGVATLVANGHEVFMETGAGRLSHFTDQHYSDAGAQIAFNAQEVYKTAELLLKVAPPTQPEIQQMAEGQVLISALHLGSTRSEFYTQLQKKNITAIAFEFIREEDDTFPIVRILHEITGSMSIQLAAHYLESFQKGQGIVLGGISGIPPAVVVILGAGIIGEYAARTALGYGAQVFVLDNDLSLLRRIENALDRRIVTAMANHQYLTDAVKMADVLIGAVMDEGKRAPVWITEPMVSLMKPGSVIVDTVIDQGGCIATSRSTTHSDPVFLYNDIVHFGVPNIPAAVARTGTNALNNVLVPYVLAVGDSGGITGALWSNTALRRGTYLFNRTITQKVVHEYTELPYRDIELMMAVGGYR